MSPAVEETFTMAPPPESRLSRVRAHCRSPMRSFPGNRVDDWARVADSFRQSLHLRVQVGLAFEANARQFRHRDEALLHPHAVRKAAVRLKQVRIALVAA